MTPSRYYARVFGLVTFAVLAYLVTRILTPFAVPIMWGALLAFMLYPLHEKLTRKRGTNVSAGLLTVATLLTVAGPVFFFGLVVVRQGTARALGLALPRALLLRADEVID